MNGFPSFYTILTLDPPSKKFLDLPLEGGGQGGRDREVDREGGIGRWTGREGGGKGGRDREGDREGGGQGGRDREGGLREGRGTRMEG